MCQHAVAETFAELTDSLTAHALGMLACLHPLTPANGHCGAHTWVKRPYRGMKVRRNLMPTAQLASPKPGDWLHGTRSHDH